MPRRPRSPRSISAQVVAAVVVCGGLALLALGFISGVQYIDRQFLTDYHTEAEAWELTDVSDDGRTITVRFKTAQCAYNPFHRVELIETASTVTLTVLTRYGGGGGCDDVSVPRTTEVALESPLGDRRIVDGRTGRTPQLGSR